MNRGTLLTAASVLLVSSWTFAEETEKSSCPKGEKFQRLVERFDADGDGTLSTGERAAAKAAIREKILEKFDADKDGCLNNEEKAAAKKAFLERCGKRRENHPE